MSQCTAFAWKCSGKKARTLANFEDFYKDHRKHFKEILECLGVNPDTIRKAKNSAFKIPESKKEYVKSLLRSYTSPTMKRVRKQELPQMPWEELNPIIQEAEVFLKARLEGLHQTRELSSMYVFSKYAVKEAIAEVQSQAISRIVSDLEGFLPLLTEKTLNDSDKACLIRYYGDLLKETSQKWREIVDIVLDLREQEIFELSQQVTENGTSEEQVEEFLPLAVEDIQTVLWEAIRIYNREENTVRQTELHKPTMEELKEVKDLLEQVKVEHKKKE